jgi:hypothetical protein
VQRPALEKNSASCPALPKVTTFQPAAPGDRAVVNLTPVQP